jgi:hypothetical protein
LTSVHQTLRVNASDEAGYPTMFGALKNPWGFFHSRLRLVVLFVAVSIPVVACATYQRWRYPCVSREAGLRGEVKRGDDGKFLYFNGECWTRRPMPPMDTPF